jgi:hypothetical protein
MEQTIGLKKFYYLSQVVRITRWLTAVNKITNVFCFMDKVNVCPASGPN